MPNVIAKPAITARSTTMGFATSLNVSFGRLPVRHATAKSSPNPAPIHHVAMTPHPSASSVGDWVANTGGWKTVKYSRQMSAVNWSWMMVRFAPTDLAPGFSSFSAAQLHL